MEEQNRLPRSKTPLRDLTTYGASRAVRWDRCDYSGDEIIHVTIRADSGTPFTEEATAKLVCENVEHYCRKLRFRLFGFCVMPDHLHVLLSPNAAGHALEDWLKAFKSYTTNRYQKNHTVKRLWQRSAHDHVCRSCESAEAVLRYIAENPVRKGLVKDWRHWPWTKTYIEI